MQRSWPLILLIACFTVFAVICWQQYDKTVAPAPPVRHETITPGQAQAGRSEFLFCFWNVENLFDDRDDGRTGPGDREYDRWFAEHPELLQEKLDHLSQALLALNDGKGPDILAVAEVESVRAAELLQQALNRGLEKGGVQGEEWAYGNVLMKEVSAGRHIAPAIITRLPVARDRTRTHGSRLRILEGHVVVAGQDLTVFASHWTSQLNQDSEGRRDDYADKIYGAANAIYRSNAAADFLVCGDFNETPQAEAVTQHLHGTADVQAVRGSDRLLLYNLLADKDPAAGFGTHQYRGKWLTYDQILISPGLLDDRAWSCDPASVKVINALTRPGDRQHRPWRFGGERDKGPRGYSDHFPVTVRLQLHRP